MALIEALAVTRFQLAITGLWADQLWSSRSRPWSIPHRKVGGKASQARRSILASVFEREENAYTLLARSVRLGQRMVGGTQ